MVGTKIQLAGRFRRALVIEDSASVRRLIVRGVSDWADQIFEADTMSAARDYARHEIDLVVSDLRVHQERAHDLLAVLAKKPRPPLLVVVSGCVSTSEAFELAHLGVQGLVQKPFNMIELADGVARALERSGSMRPLAKAQRAAHSVETQLAGFAREQQLSPQQIALLRAVLIGTLRRDLACVLGMSENTCKTSI